MNGIQLPMGFGKGLTDRSTYLPSAYDLSVEIRDLLSTFDGEDLVEASVLGVALLRPRARSAAADLPAALCLPICRHVGSICRQRGIHHRSGDRALRAPRRFAGTDGLGAESQYPELHSPSGARFHLVGGLSRRDVEAPRPHVCLCPARSTVERRPYMPSPRSMPPMRIPGKT